MSATGTGRRPIVPLAAAIALVIVLMLNASCKAESALEGCSAMLKVDKAEYGQGEAIRLQLRLGNENEDPMTLTFASSQIYDFWVKDSGGSEVWRWSASRVFLAVITHVDILPGATIEYAETWDQLNDGGATVPPGTYTIHAGIVIADTPRIDPVTVVIR